MMRTPTLVDLVALLRVSYRQKSAAGVVAEREPAIFVLTVRFIVNGQRQCIQKDCGGLIEGHSVLANVVQCFGGIPLEIVDSLRGIPTVKTARVLGRSGALDALVLTPISVA
jgi:hypothetical protein